MTKRIRQVILRCNAVFLLAASTGGLMTDINGAFFGNGPERAILDRQPLAGAGFLEAHGLALILGVLFWRAAALRSWHLTAAAVHTLLGAVNLVVWEIFIVMGMVEMGYLTTALHVLFVMLQLSAALAATRELSDGWQGGRMAGLTRQ